MNKISWTCYSNPRIHIFKILFYFSIFIWTTFFRLKVSHRQSNKWILQLYFTINFNLKYRKYGRITTDRVAVNCDKENENSKLWICHKIVWNVLVTPSEIQLAATNIYNVPVTNYCDIREVCIHFTQYSIKINSVRQLSKWKNNENVRTNINRDFAYR